MQMDKKMQTMGEWKAEECMKRSTINTTQSASGVAPKTTPGTIWYGDAATQI